MKIQIAGMQYYADPTIDRQSPRWHDEEHLACIASVFKQMEEIMATGIPCIVLQPEPTNQYSKTAVSVHYKSKLIGYVREEQTVTVLQLIKENGGMPLLCKIVEVSAEDKNMFVHYGNDDDMEMPDTQLAMQTDAAWKDVRIEGIDGTPLFSTIHQRTNALKGIIMQLIIPQILTIDADMVNSYAKEWKDNMFVELSGEASSVTNAMIAAYGKRSDLKDAAKMLDKAMVSRGGWKSIKFRRMQMVESILNGKEIANLHEHMLREAGSEDALAEKVRSQLMALPDNLIDAVNDLEHFMSKLSYLHLPEQLLDNVFALALMYHYITDSIGEKSASETLAADFMKALRTEVRKASRNAPRNSRVKVTIAPYAAAYLMAFRDGKPLPISQLNVNEFNKMLDSGNEIHKSKFSTYTTHLHHADWNNIPYKTFELEKYFRLFEKFVK